MPAGLEAKRGKTARVRRALAKREPKAVENPRTALLIRGQKTSGLINDVLTDLFMLKKPHAVHFKRQNAAHPFEDATPLEFLCQKNDSSLFAFGTHSKKRPHNLVLGRMFDFHLLDMVELGVEAFRPMASFAEAQGGCASETKPCLLFQGAEWEQQADLIALRSVLCDFFQLQVVDAISSTGLEHVLSFTAHDGKVWGRHYLVRLRKAAEAGAPYVELQEMGPSLDLVVRRAHHPAPDLMKAALVKPKATDKKPKKVKNVEHSRLGGRQGRLHVDRQDLRKLVTHKSKALRAERPEGAEPRPEKKQRVALAAQI